MRQIAFLSLFMLFAQVLVAQAKVTEDSRQMSLGPQSCMVIDLPSTEEKIANTVWKEYLKKLGGKTKRNSKAEEYFTDDASLVGFDGNATDIYSRIDDKGNKNYQLIVWVDTGNGFMTRSSHAGAYDELEKTLQRFALDVKRETTLEELKREENKLKDLENELRRLVKDNERYHAEIDRAKETIKKREADIQQNMLDQAKNTGDTESQKKAIEEVKKRLEALKAN